MSIIKRLTYIIIILLGASSIVHTMIYLIPGDPAVMMAGEYANPEDIQKIRSELSLDKSFFYRYLIYVKNSAMLNLGKSIYSNEPVTQIILDRFPATFSLACFAMAIAAIAGILLGVIAGVLNTRKIDNIILSVSSLFISTPIFVTCFLFTLVFSHYLNLLPPSGRAGYNPVYIILPSLALASRSIALIIRVTRNELISVMKKQYIKNARALGFSEKKVIMIFALKNIIVPVLAVILLDFGSYLGGAVVTESIFAWPGMGRLLIVSLLKRDLPVIQAVILFGTILFIFMGILIEFLQRRIDPKTHEK